MSTIDVSIPRAQTGAHGRSESDFGFRVCHFGCRVECLRGNLFGSHKPVRSESSRAVIASTTASCITRELMILRPYGRQYRRDKGGGYGQGNLGRIGVRTCREAVRQKPSKGEQPVFLTDLICTTSHRIPASDCTNRVKEKSDLVTL
jgi:hypothetical protein